MVFIILYATLEDEKRIYPEIQKRFKDSKLEGIIFLKQFILEGESHFGVLNGSKQVYNSEKFSSEEMHGEIDSLLEFLKAYRK